MTSPTVTRSRWPALVLLLNALVWGVSWWPLRQLQEQGLHPLWATALIYLVAVVAILAWRREAWGQLLRTRSLWIIAAAAGTTNACFNWGVTVGDVVRVVLLFYLMPLWAVLLARVLLAEPITVQAVLRIGLALTGAAIVLQPAGGGWPLPNGLPEVLGLVGGFTFALNNVMLRREARQPEAGRAMAMFVGGALVSSVLAATLALQGLVPGIPPPSFGWIVGGIALATAFLAGNMALQYGAARLPAHVTAVVMVTEVLFASASAVLLGAGTLTTPLLLGGALIIGAALRWR